jgi:hydrogenase maturation protein HypF
MQLRIYVQGRVQGVGFRPSIYRHAKSLGLSGFVRNLGNGNVEILLQGRKAVIDAFLGSLEDALPPLAEIMKMETEVTKAPGQRGFRILESGSPSRDTSTSFIPQDVAMCDSCLKELMDGDDRRFEYPFITCTDCGPRFTISRGPPFDRENTSMQPFPMCKKCSSEYADPDDRRYHAQTIACAECGPRVWLMGPGGRAVRTKDPIGRTAKLIDRGEIAAVKGVGGTHIACDAANDGAVKALRRILKRPYQPFALMARGLQDVMDFASVGPQEREWLLDWRRPIVVLDKLEPFPLSALLAPDLGNIGVMLPYTPVHHLLLSKTKSPVLVMTSANVHDEPMILEQGRMRERLGAIGYLLWHNREIANRCDDSVVRFHVSDPVVIRRSRGYVPHPIEVGTGDGHVVLGVGPELSSTACVLKSGLAYLTQHIGNTSNFDTFNYLKDAISSLMKNTNTLHLDAVAHDLHPDFLSTRLARSLSETWDCPAYPVQHHFAHVYSLMAERRVKIGRRVMAIVSDGYGYGTDGEAWGGEVLGVDGEEVRLGSLEPQPLIGGDEATMHPVRVATGILAKVYKEDRLRRVIRRFCYDGLIRGERELDLIIQQLDRGYNVHQTTSTGRVLDAVSALLGISYERTYEGEGAMRLEGVALRGNPAALELPVDVSRKGDRCMFETTPILEGVVDALEARISREDIAASAQDGVGRGLAAMANLCGEEFGPDVVGCSGGVMYNRQIVSVIEANLRFPLLKHVHLPPGDGCISLGQAALARWRLGDGIRSA